MVAVTENTALPARRKRVPVLYDVQPEADVRVSMEVLWKKENRRITFSILGKTSSCLQKPQAYQWYLLCL